MKTRVLLLSVLFVALSSATAQTMFRDLSYGESCPSIAAKLENFDDFTFAPNGRSCTSYSGAPEFILGGSFDYLFGQRDVFANIWFERPGDGLARIVFLVGGINGYHFIEAAIEGFTLERGQPELRRSVDPYEMVSQGSARGETLARWPGENGVVIEVEAFADPSWGTFSGSVRVRYEKPVTPTTPAQDAGQF